MDNPFHAPEADVISPDEGYAPLKILGFSGRLGRLRYLVYSFVSMLIFGIAMAAVIGLIVAVTGQPVVTSEDSLSPAVVVAYVILLIPMLIVSLMFGIRRLHDMNLSGWFIILMLIPFVSAVFYLVLLFWPGTKGPNRFGPPPPPNSTGIKIGAAVLILFLIASMLAAIAVPAYQKYLQRAAESTDTSGLSLEWAASHV